MATLPAVMTYDQLVNDAGFTEDEAQAYLEDEAAAAADNGAAPSVAETPVDRDDNSDGSDGDDVVIEDARDSDPDAGDGVVFTDAASDDAQQQAATPDTPAEPDPLADLLSVKYTPGVAAETVQQAREFDATAAIKEATEAFENADLTSDEFAAKVATINAAQREAERVIAAAENNPSQDEYQAMADTWGKLTEAYQAANPSLNSGQALAAFDSALRQFTKNEGPIRNLPMSRIIERAHREVVDVFLSNGVELPEPVPFKQIKAAKGAPAAKQTAEDKAIANPAALQKPNPADRPKAPQTLGNVSNEGDGVGGEDPRFAQLDTMSDEKAEAELAKMPPAMRSAYLRR